MCKYEIQPKYKQGQVVWSENLYDKDLNMLMHLLCTQSEMLIKLKAEVKQYETHIIYGGQFDYIIHGCRFS